MNLDHVTLRTADLEGTRSFLERVLDLKPGYRPAFSFPGYWLYAGGEPIVHLIPGRSSRVDRSGETIDHAGYRSLKTNTGKSPVQRFLRRPSSPTMKGKLFPIRDDDSSTRGDSVTWDRLTPMPT